MDIKCSMILGPIVQVWHAEGKSFDTELLVRLAFMFLLLMMVLP